MPDTGLAMEMMALNKTDKMPGLKELTFWRIIVNYLLKLDIKVNNSDKILTFHFTFLLEPDLISLNSVQHQLCDKVIPIKMSGGIIIKITNKNSRIVMKLSYARRFSGSPSQSFIQHPSGSPPVVLLTLFPIIFFPLCSSLSGLLCSSRDDLPPCIYLILPNPIPDFLCLQRPSLI